MSENHFSVLSDETSPDDESRPINRAINQIGHTSTRKTIKVLNLNCQSFVNKKAEFYALLEYHDPDIVIGTESWLRGKHLDSEYFPQSKGYTPFRHDRNSETQGGAGRRVVFLYWLETHHLHLSRNNCKLIEKSYGYSWKLKVVNPIYNFLLQT